MSEMGPSGSLMDASRMDDAENSQVRDYRAMLNK